MKKILGTAIIVCMAMASVTAVAVCDSCRRDQKVLCNHDQHEACVRNREACAQNMPTNAQYEIIQTETIRKCYCTCERCKRAENTCTCKACTTVCHCECECECCKDGCRCYPECTCGCSCCFDRRFRQEQDKRKCKKEKKWEWGKLFGVGVSYSSPFTPEVTEYEVVTIQQPIGVYIAQSVPRCELVPECECPVQYSNEKKEKEEPKQQPKVDQKKDNPYWDSLILTTEPPMTQKEYEERCKKEADKQPVKVKEEEEAHAAPQTPQPNVVKRKVWIEGHFGVGFLKNGMTVYPWVPGHYEECTVVYE